VGSVKGVILLSLIGLTCRPYNNGHTILCDISIRKLLSVGNKTLHIQEVQLLLRQRALRSGQW